MLSMHKHLLISGFIMAAMVPLPALAQNAAQNQAEAEQQGIITVVPAHRLINRALRDPQGHDAGRIDGIVLDNKTGAVDFAIISGDGNFNLNGNVIAVPWSAIEPPTTTNGPVTVKIPAQRLEQAPRLNPSAVASLEQPRTRAGMYGWYHYRYAPYARYGAPGALGAPYYRGGPGTAGVYAGQPPEQTFRNNGNGENSGSTAAAGGGNNINAGGNENGNYPNRNNVVVNNVAANRQVSPAGRELEQQGLVIGPSGVVSSLESTSTTSANAMRSASVFTRNGRDIGQIERVLIDPQHGEVAFALIKEGGFLGLTPHWFAVPVQALEWTPYRGGYRLTVSAQALASEPSLTVNENNLPTRIQTQQLAQLYEHFGVQPYWEQGNGGNGTAR